MAKILYKKNESGNALIYVLIGIALFAALGFTLTRQNAGTSTKELDNTKIELYAMRLITQATQAKSVVDQMLISGSDIDDFNFSLPGEAAYTTLPHIHKVYHPLGGGLSPTELPKDAIHQIGTSPEAGWYMGRFNNVEWSDSTETDIIFTAYQIDQKVCEAINEKITGSNAIPALNNDMNVYLVDTATDSDLDTSACADCEGYMTLCVSNVSVSAYSFYSVLADR